MASHKIWAWIRRRRDPVGVGDDEDVYMICMIYDVDMCVCVLDSGGGLCSERLLPRRYVSKDKTFVYKCHHLNMSQITRHGFTQVKVVFAAKTWNRRWVVGKLAIQLRLFLVQVSLTHQICICIMRPS